MNCWGGHRDYIPTGQQTGPERRAYSGRRHLSEAQAELSLTPKHKMSPSPKSGTFDGHPPSPTHGALSPL